MDINWTTLVLGVLSPVSALGGVCLTLWFQERRERSGSGLNIAVELLDSAESFHFALKRAAKREERADSWEELTADSVWTDLNEEAKKASRRWATARLRAELSFRSETLQAQIKTTASAIYAYDQEYMKVGPGPDETSTDDPQYVEAREKAWAEVETLRRAMRERRGNRF